MSIDQFFNRVRSPEYNCAHFTVEVWKHLTGRDVTETLSGFLLPAGDREAKLGDLRSIRLLKRPESPCMVLMQSPIVPPHAGIWLNGRVLHLLENSKVQYQPLEVASIGFKKVRFFVC